MSTHIIVDYDWRNRYMKRLCVIILLLFALIGCSSKISFDNQYGVGYYLDDSGITIHLDKNKTDRIADIWITVSNSDSILPELSSSWNTDITKEEDYPITYYAYENEDGTYFEHVVLRFFMGEFNKKDAQPLLDYLGISELLDDSVLTYKTELLENDSFKYKSIIENGKYINNISFEGDPEYVYN